MALYFLEYDLREQGTIRRYMQQRFAAEMARVVAENPQLQQAILDYEAVERAYDEARADRRTRDCDGPEPPARCSR